jgi:hypothetical protein
VGFFYFGTIIAPFISINQCRRSNFMDNVVGEKKCTGENTDLKREIRRVKIKRFQAKVLDISIRMSKLIYIIPIIIILSLFAYNRLIGAFVAIAYLFIASIALEKFEKDSRVIKFMDNFSEENCKDKIEEIESRIEHNNSCF